jgi:hypothetical protein
LPHHVDGVRVDLAQLRQERLALRSVALLPELKHVALRGGA